MTSVLVAHLVLRMAELPGLIVAMVVLWLLIIGGSIGSFLNVVIYRLPAGLSLVRPASRCPRCGTPILARDNIPVLGWLLLRGKCRACRSEISPRYPTVELLMALIFLGLAWCEPLSNAVNLPISRGAAANYPLWGLLLYHFTLLCGLIAAALMMFDGEAVPRKFWLFIGSVGLIAGTIWPLLHPVGVPQLDREWSATVFGLVEGAAGALLGIALGAAAWPASTAVGQGRAGNIAGPAMLAVVGVYLGWQAVAAISVIAATQWSAGKLVCYALGSCGRFGWPAFVALTTLVWLFTWRWIVVGWPVLGSSAPWYVAPVAVALTLLVSLSGRALADSVRRKFV